MSSHILHLTTIREIAFEVRALIVGPEVSVENVETLLVVSQSVPALEHSAHGKLYLSPRRLPMSSKLSIAKEDRGYLTMVSGR